MSDHVIKTYKGESAAQRGIAVMKRNGYEIDQLSTRKVMWSPDDGLVYPEAEAHDRVQEVG
jgi:hypothetical protein